MRKKANHKLTIFNDYFLSLSQICVAQKHFDRFTKAATLCLCQSVKPSNYKAFSEQEMFINYNVH